MKKEKKGKQVTIYLPQNGTVTFTEGTSKVKQIIGTHEGDGTLSVVICYENEKKIEYCGMPYIMIHP